MTHLLTLGVDTGGTFTDFVWLDAYGRLQIHKQLSTPHDPSQAILTGVNQLAIPETAVVVHGSTVATNALLERKGARTALITTARLRRCASHRPSAPPRPLCPRPPKTRATCPPKMAVSRSTSASPPKATSSPHSIRLPAYNPSLTRSPPTTSNPLPYLLALIPSCTSRA